MFSHSLIVPIPIFGQWSIPCWQAFSFSPLPLVVYPSIFAAEGRCTLCFLQTTILSLFLYLADIWSSTFPLASECFFGQCRKCEYRHHAFPLEEIQKLLCCNNLRTIFFNQYLSVHIRHIWYIIVIYFRHLVLRSWFLSTVNLKG